MIEGVLVVVMWGVRGGGELPGKGGRGWHRDVQDRTPSCLLHKPHHILLPQLLWRTQGAERCAPSGGDYVECCEGFFTLISDHRARIPSARKKKTHGMLSLSLSARSVSKEQWRHRSFTMSCLDVMYPAYGHYAPYAPTAPAFINSLQVGSEQIFICLCDISSYFQCSRGSGGR